MSSPLRISTASLFALASSLMAQPASTPAKETKYLAAARSSADAILAKGIDTYGDVKSGMILSVLDRQTGAPLRKLPPAPFGIRYGDRTRVGGSNANLQMDLYRALEHLSRITGDPRYADAAQLGLRDFLRITQHPDTGFLAWGEHLFWDCFKDTLGDEKYKTHEQKRKFISFEYLYGVDPERTLKYARGLWDHQIADQETGDFSRHAKYDTHAPRTGFDFPKEGSYFIDIWSRAYAHTKDPVFDRAASVLAKRYLGRTNERGLLDFDSSNSKERSNMCVTLWLISLALECHDSAPRLTPPTGKLLMELAATQDKGFLSLAHEPANPEKGFVCYAFTDSGEPRPREEKESLGYSRHWGMGYGVNTTSMFATLCYSRQAQLPDGAQREAYRKLVIEAANLYRNLPPDPQQADIWAGEYGLAILTELAAYRLTADKSYLEAAQKIGDQALATLWDNDSALPRASSKTDYFDVTSYPDTLILAMLALHEATIGAAPVVEISDITR